jgi:hypothetical protein
MDHYRFADSGGDLLVFQEVVCQLDESWAHSLPLQLWPGREWLREKLLERCEQEFGSNQIFQCIAHAPENCNFFLIAFPVFPADQVRADTPRGNRAIRARADLDYGHELRGIYERRNFQFRLRK